MFDANCIGKGEMFFPGKGESGVANEAKKLCEQCVVSDECDAYAKRMNTEYGVWAGKLYQPSGRNNGDVAPPV